MPDILPRPFAGGRYELVALIGRGGMARVYRARDGVLRVDRAIKVLTAEDATRTRRGKRLLVEAQAMERVRHPHILQVHDVGDSDDGPFVVMDLATGGSLDERLAREGPLPPRSAVLWMADILDALASAHNHGIIHRDVKPSNVLLGPDGEALLADFGIALLAEERERMTRTGATLGSLAFMAPEQRLDARSVDARADVYAACSTLYNLLTGATPVDLFVAGGESPRWLDVPEALRPILVAGTRHDPAERPPTAKALRERLLAVVDALPSEALPGRSPMPRAVHALTATSASTPGTSGGEVSWSLAWTSVAAVALAALLGLGLRALPGPEELEAAAPEALASEQALPAGLAAEAAGAASAGDALAEGDPDPASPGAPEADPEEGAAGSWSEGGAEGLAEPLEVEPGAAPEPESEPGPAPGKWADPAAAAPEPPGASESPAAAALLSLPAPEGPGGPVAGRWQGVQAGLTVTLALSGEEAVRGVSEFRMLDGAPVRTPLRGAFDPGAGSLHLQDEGEAHDAGAYDLFLAEEGDVLRGRFTAGRTGNVVAVVLRRVD